MKLLKKTHIWKDVKTFLEIESINPEIENNYVKQGNIIIKIGQQQSIKSAFKLSPDEARAVRDVLDMFLRYHDIELSKLMTKKQKEYSTYKNREDVEIETTPNSIIQKTSTKSYDYKEKNYPNNNPYHDEQSNISETYEPNNSLFNDDYSNKEDEESNSIFSNNNKKEDEEKYDTEFYF